VNIGQLRHRVTFQRAVVIPNELGEPETDWADIVTTWARVEAVAGKERFSAMQIQADVDYRITCRYQSALADLAPADRALWGKQIFDIKSVLNTEGRNTDLQIFARRHL